MIWLAGVVLFCAAIPAVLFLRNLGALRPPPASAPSAGAAAILIPARDEERNILAAVEAAIASGAAEVVVLDDHSTDRTAEIVRQFAATSPRVRLIASRPLPPDWRGKNFACAQLAAATAQPILIFADADVQLAPDSAGRLAAFLALSGAELASGIPRQITVGFPEQLLLPLIHFLLLGFLPLARMRASGHPAYGAGCGQLFVARAAAYQESGGHSAIRRSVHDGLTLPRNFRAHALRTDLFDATDIATCRMYRSAREIWAGLTKNTIEGLGAPALIVPMSAILALGQVAPFFLVFAVSPTVRSLGMLAAAMALLPRLLALRRFRQPPLGVALHPVAITVLLGIQWFGLIRFLFGSATKWKGRIYSSLVR